jgi:hypothetical protein
MGLHGHLLDLLIERAGVGVEIDHGWLTGRLSLPSRRDAPMHHGTVMRQLIGGCREG